MTEAQASPEWPRPYWQPGADEDALLAESVSSALLVVLERLSPAHRVTFVMHDVFAMPFDQIAAVMNRDRKSDV